MTALDLDRFRKVCGLLGSEHDGERAAAASRATAMLGEAGKSWADIEIGPAYVSIDWAAAILQQNLDSERARTTQMAEEITRLKREVARLKGMWRKEPA